MATIKPYAWITVTLLVVAFLVLILHVSTTGEEFSRYNIGWTGTSDFFSTLDRHTTIDSTGPSDLAGYKNATLLVLAPDHAVTPAEGTLYRDFVAQGNTLLLADDFGSGNEFLQSMGSSIVIRQGTLFSVDRAYNNASMAVVYPAGDTRFLPAGSSLVLDTAATLTGGAPLIRSSAFSWVEKIPGNTSGGVKVLGTYTVMAQETIGDGTVYVLSDPSVFINGMDDPGQSYANRVFRKNIAGSPGPVLVDTYLSRTGRVEGMGEIIQLVRSTTAYRFVIAAVLMAGVLIAWRRRLI